MIYIIIILLIFSAFFSSLETALFHLKSSSNKNEIVKELLKKPKKLLSNLLTGNTIVNIAIGSLSAAYTLNVISPNSSLSVSNLLFIQVTIITFILLIFGEVIPKTYAIVKSEKLANSSAKLLRLILKIIYPVAFVFHKITDLIVKLLPIKKEQAFDSEEELIMLAEVGEEEGTLDHEESDMIQSVFEFKNKLVKEIQTPRVDISALDSTSSLDDAMDLIMKKKFSKIPVYKDTIDNIKGILYAKDIIPYLIGSRPSIDLLKLTRSPYFTPETKPIDEVLQEFKIKKTSIAVVVDEWGGTSGLLTLEDIVEEVMGEFRDPYDSEEYEIIDQDDGSKIVDGSINIYDIEEYFNINFPDDRDYDTLAGFILDSIGDIPKKGQEVKFDKFIFKVILLDQNRIEKIKVFK
ncbi:MAG: hemolysin [Candidatus Marinimicrobia bacterium]|nr:hemolysin [Candidatus Neomarinimicrobiota bacterium]|tara:strand:+ start:3713 stop:4930 length:1218 start_codon:yes stop_codon:yes gene_type:complete